jgi:dTDP-4-dehydrorhamnose reductase
MGALRDTRLIGCVGQVAAQVRRVAPADWRVTAPPRSELDRVEPEPIGRVAASRPWAARLLTDKTARDFGVSPRPWRDAVEEVVGKLLGTTSEKGAAP